MVSKPEDRLPVTLSLNYPRRRHSTKLLPGQWSQAMASLGREALVAQSRCVRRSFYLEVLHQTRLRVKQRSTECMYSR
jgi:hypothetical protein